jgi:hypothetical protein
MTDTTTLPKPKLREDVLYLIGDRFACASVQCAGYTALYTGRGINGEKSSPVTVADVAEWDGYDMGPLTCEGGHKAAVLVDGRVVVRDVTA